MSGLSIFRQSFLLVSFSSLLCNSAVIAGENNPPPTKGSLTSPSMVVSQGPVTEKMQPYNKDALHRLDFRIQGKSCAICLMGIQRRVRELTGALKVAVMLKKPYGVSIIYDSSKVTEEKLIATAKLNEPLIKVLDVNDTSIEKIPVILIPPHITVQSGTDSAILPSN